MYSHYWTYQPGHPGYVKAWPTILDDTRRIIERTRAAGIVIAGPDGHRRPVLDPAEGVSFNGDATSDLAGQPLQLLAPRSPVPAGTATATAFCKTRRKPYDLAVAAVLLRCVMLVPEAFALSSDGAWEREWARGAMLTSSASGVSSASGAPAGPGGARTVVAELFGAVPASNPLRPTVAGVRFAPTPGPT